MSSEIVVRKAGLGFESKWCEEIRTVYEALLLIMPTFGVEIIKCLEIWLFRCGGGGAPFFRQAWFGTEFSKELRTQQLAFFSVGWQRGNSIVLSMEAGGILGRWSLLKICFIEQTALEIFLLTWVTRHKELKCIMPGRHRRGALSHSSLPELLGPIHLMTLSSLHPMLMRSTFVVILSWQLLMPAGAVTDERNSALATELRPAKSFHLIGRDGLVQTSFCSHLSLLRDTVQ